MVALTPTTTAITAATVAKFIATISARQYDQLPGFLAPNSVWWVLGNPDLATDSGGAGDAHDRLTVLRHSAVYTNYSTTITNQVTEGRKSSVEFQTLGELQKGPDYLRYLNNVSMVFALDDDYKIELVHEYSDQIEVNWLINWLAEHNVTSST